MITLIQDDIFNSICDLLVNPVNVAGISGAGLALQFKQHFQTAQTKFEERCKQNLLKMGMIFVAKDVDRIICFLPTKVNPRHKSNERDIYESLICLRFYMVNNGYQSVAIPALGCGLGGLDFARIRRAVEYVFRDWPGLRVDLYEPRG